ncbi:hypothetical protein F8388_026771 [Cannabis sativa]|uniref:Uncharacterized protein n=1 Tax=Cannabis sativa TaxID=3483 RepID=A0A7J6H1F2_CANSA|nr:hypothetical protein F8388_026771 [Cannabis sativa]
MASKDECIAINPYAVPKKRKKIIGLDELVSDFYKEQSKNMIELSGEEETSEWGIQLFRDQKSPPSPCPVEDCGLLKSFMNSELNSLVELSLENGDSFIEGLLVGGWLTKLVLTYGGHVEESIAVWTYNLVLYSTKENLRTSACDFWSAILSLKKEPIKIDWFPNYSELRKALEVYGFLLSNIGAADAKSSCGGPSQNIRSWIKFVTAACQFRSKWSIFSTSEAEELVEVVICFFLDRQLQGLSVLLYECAQAVIGYFTDEEWNASCEKIAKSLACRVPKDMNCIRVVECISGIDDRSKQLRSAVAFEILIGFFDKKVTSCALALHFQLAAHPDDILRLLIGINLKDKKCDLYKMYMYLILTQNWLLSKNLLEDNGVLKEMYSLYLRNCSCQISSTDLRTFASKVRDKASFLLQGATKI